jgi:hypothetical protein
MLSEALFSSKTDQWETPQSFFDELNKEFHFTLDPCADEHNYKCKKFFTREQNGLLQDWGGDSVFVNPPYGKEIYQWVEKCYWEGHKENTVVVLLIPARTDTKYFHDFILNRSEVRFVKGRLKFGDSNNSAPFPSMVVVFRGCKLKERTECDK